MSVGDFPIGTFKKESQVKKPHSVSASGWTLLYGGAYNFKHQPERLKYIGKHKGWHQFEKVGVMGVWCELLDSDLHMIEETKIKEAYTVGLISKEERDKLLNDITPILWKELYNL